ncbi:MAG: DUF3106 domain-containing protein [Thermodesulfobacteriota bacterium]
MAWQEAEDQSLAEVRGQDGSLADVISSQVFGKPGMSLEEMKSAWSGMSPDQQAQARMQARSSFLALPEAKKSELFSQLMGRYRQMSPEDRAQFIAQQQDRFSTMSAEEQAQARAVRREFFQSLTPSEQRQILSDLRAAGGR